MALGLIGLGLLIGIQYAGLTWHNASQLDQHEVHQSTLRVQAMLNREEDVLVAVSDEYGWWSDLITAFETLDMDWISDEFDGSLNIKYGISEVIVLDEQNSPLYAQVMSEPVTQGKLLGWDLELLQPLIDETKASPADLPRSSSGLLSKNKTLYVVTAAALTHSDEYIASSEQPSRPTLLMMAELDDPLLQLKAASLQVNNLIWSVEKPAADVVLPIRNKQGQIQGYLSWTTDKPGAIVISTVALWSTPITILTLLFGITLLRRFQAVIKRSRDLEIRSAVIEQSQNYFQSMSDDAPVLIWQTDMRGEITYGNHQFYAFWDSIRPGQRAANMADLQVEGTPMDLLGLFSNIEHTDSTNQGEFEFLTKCETTCWLSVVGTPHRKDAEEFDCILFIATDITDIKNAELLSWQQANFDSLTQLPNRSLLQDRLEHVLALAKRNEAEIGLMFIDLDNFKKINDSLGHGAGDEVLKEAARRISACLRKCDTVARLGGDEFVILLPDAEDRSSINEVAQRIQNTLSKSMCVSSSEVRVTASIGVAYYPRDGTDRESLMMQADTAMYRAKNNGRNDIAFYDSSMNSNLRETIELEAKLEHAIQRGELFVVYQPIFNLAQESPVGFEALCRWALPDGSVVPADKIILLAEGAGLMRELGDQILVTACKQLKEWQQQNRECYIALNLSPTQFSDRHLVQRIKQLIAIHDIDPQALQLELIETILLKNADNTLEMLQELSELGIKLAVDDFGTGYSALSYLRRFPVDTLKIDRSFISEITGSQRDQALLRAIITMARSLGMEVVAKGVETEVQLEFLRSLGCDLVQGYLLGRPADANETCNFFDSRSTVCAVTSQGQRGRD